MDETLIPVAPRDGGQQGTVFVYLSLFFLILAFFIVLVAISTVEETKSKAVMHSLTSTFATLLPTGDKPTDFTAKEGEVLGRQEFQEKVTGIFATSLQVAKVKVVKPGSLMRARMPASAMFYEGETRFRQNVFPFMDRTIAALGSRPPGLRFDMEFVIGAPYTDNTNLPADETLEMARAGSFVREMIARGAPPDSISIGLSPGDPEQITMRFYVRYQDEVRLRFSGPS